MKTTSISALAIALIAAMSIPALAQIELIGPLLVVPGQPITTFYTNVIPPQPSYKEFEFLGMASVPAGAVGTLQIDFDYVDSAGNMVLVPAPNGPFMIPGGQPVPINSGIFTLPFCPLNVSLHLTNVANPTSPPIQLQGTYRHQCFPVPEPTGLGSLACLGVLGLVRRRIRTAFGAA